MIGKMPKQCVFNMEYGIEGVLVLPHYLFHFTFSEINLTQFCKGNKLTTSLSELDAIDGIFAQITLQTLLHCGFGTIITLIFF